MVANGRNAGRWGAYAALGIGLALIAAAGDGRPQVAANSGANANKEQSRASDATQGQARAPAVIQIEPSAKAIEAEAERQSAQRRIFWLEPDAWVALFTLVLGISTIGLWLETKRLAGLAEDEGKDLKNSIAEAARAATAMEGVSTALQATAKNNELITERQRQAVRAYVFVISGNLYTGITVNPPQTNRPNEPFIQLEIRNSGPTPAFNVDTWGWISIIEPSQEHTLTIPVRDNNNRSSVGGYQNYPKYAWLRRALTSSEIEDVTAGVKRIYFHGQINYMTLGEAHTTNFRLCYFGEFPPKLPGPLVFAEKGNEAD